MSNSGRVADIATHLHSQTDPRAHEARGPLIITGGQGARVTDADGREYIDGMASLWCASLGFADDRLAQTAYDQMRRLATYHSFNHRVAEPAIALTAALAEISPIPDPKVFLAGSGSEANDTMVKIAWAWNVAQGRLEKRRIISRQGGFHGSTVFGAALSGLPHMHRAFNLPTADVIYAGRAHHYRDARPGETEAEFAARLAAELEALILAEGPETIAAMIAEPVMGAGGVFLPPADYFPRIHAVLRKYDILLLADEIICGFGRTGSWFGCQTYGFVPDMMGVAKGLSAGHLPIAAVLMSDRVYQVLADQSHAIGVFGHGFTYSGHPVTSAVAAEALKIYREIDIVALARARGADLACALQATFADHPLVGQIRQVGFLAGVELVADRATGRAFDADLRVGARVERAATARGAIIRNMGDTLAFCPPYVITPSEIDALVERVAGALNAVSKEI